MTQWKYQARIFTEKDPKDLRKELKTSDLSGREKNATDLYVVGPSPIVVRTRDGQIKIKGPRSSIDAVVDELRDDRLNFPISSATVDEAIGLYKKQNPGQLLTEADLMKYAASRSEAVATKVAKESMKYDSYGIPTKLQRPTISSRVGMATMDRIGTKPFELEVSQVTIDGKVLYTVAVASNDVAQIHDVLNQLGILRLPNSRKMEYAEAIRNYHKQ